ncbi:hypothetical protein [Flavobacterium lindanitolerans]|nr:hypothetical protein [Flavobacterium lindanitolerans]MDQ7960232.1 hypothetical protein [Flavobacterium lindanitolerans]
MKKAILTFGLFSLVVLTSFTTTETKTQSMIAETGDTGGQGQMGNGNTTIGSGNKRLDFGDVKTNKTKITDSTSDYSNNLSFNSEARKKSDI